MKVEPMEDEVVKRCCSVRGHGVELLDCNIFCPASFNIWPRCLTACQLPDDLYILLGCRNGGRQAQKMQL